MSARLNKKAEKAEKAEKAPNHKRIDMVTMIMYVHVRLPATASGDSPATGCIVASSCSPARRAGLLPMLEPLIYARGAELVRARKSSDKLGVAQIVHADRARIITSRQIVHPL